jgi:L-malate glycosyltransferase
MLLTNPLHILFLTNWFPSRVHTTNGNFVRRHAEAVATLHKVTVLYVVSDIHLRNLFDIEQERTNNLHIIRVYFKPSKKRLVHVFRKASAFKKGFKLINSFDIIHLNIMHYYGLIALYYKIVKKIPYVITEHWTWWNDNSMSMSELFWDKIIAAKASYILPVCATLGKNIHQHIKHIPQYIIPNSIDSTIFYAGSHTVESNYIFLHISSLLDKQKNITGILNAVKKLALTGSYKFELHIGGDGDVTPIHKFRDENHLHSFIQTFGELTPEEVANKMRKSNTFVLFSNQENQPCVINEAFACGLPVITTDVGGIAEFFPKNYGILINKGDINGLCNAMICCLEGHLFASSTAISHYALSTFEKNVIASKFHQIYSFIFNEK